MERKLAAILAADVVGFSRLIGDNEEATIATPNSHRQVIDRQIENRRGRIFGTAGDSVIAEFSSPVEALRCAVEMQQGIEERNNELPENQRMRFRVGVNLGDVMIVRDDLLGDGVNIAARLEGIAEPGGICISGTMFDQVEGKLDLAMSDLGTRQVKNIAKPLRVYSVSVDEPRVVAAAHSGQAPPLPDKPSIAVLPFDNLSGDREQDFFADGMAEDIMTGLSRFRWLPVIGRNTTFAYKGRSPDMHVVARELGVRYVLEGSIRKQSNRIRITAQLIDAAKGNHIWAERYDRDLDDIFAVQDEITEAIVTAIEPQISQKERERAQRKPPSSLDAWGQYQRGLAAYYTTTEHGLASAIDMFDRVNELEPHFQAAFAMAAEARVRYVMFYRADERAVLLEQARQKAQQGISLDPADPLCLFADGRVNALLGQFDLATSQIEEAIALNPNWAMAHYALGWALMEAGRPLEAIPRLDSAIHLSPHDPFLSGFQHMRARALFALRRYQECIEWERRATRSPNAHLWAFVTLAAAFFKLDRDDEARVVVADLLQRAPHFSISHMNESFSEEDPLNDTKLIEDFRQAGVPD